MSKPKSFGERNVMSMLSWPHSQSSVTWCVWPQFFSRSGIAGSRKRLRVSGLMTSPAWAGGYQMR